MTDDKLQPYDRGPLATGRSDDDGPYFNLPTPSCAACGRAEVEAIEFVHGPRLCLMPVRCHGHFQIVVVPREVIDDARRQAAGRMLPKRPAFVAGEPYLRNREQYELLRAALVGVQGPEGRYRLDGRRLMAAWADDPAYCLRSLLDHVADHGLVIVQSPTVGDYYDAVELRWAEDVANWQGVVDSVTLSQNAGERPTLRVRRLQTGDE